jgi:BirA family transcriptional regulator, biotin operon repressor / biotin---[acetyl-CoA-carboxylase] ligase
MIRDARDHDAVSEGLEDLPSVFTPIVPLREAGDAMWRAVELAPREGAGTLAWVRSWSRIEAAVVLEPEQVLAAARPALLAAMTAFADAAGALGPPEVPLTFDWPATIRVNGGVVGQARIAAPPGCAEDAVPDWLVVGIEVAFAAPSDADPGRDPGRTTLFEEGYNETSPAEMTAAWARHLMATLADWQGRGFRIVAERYLARLDPAIGAGALRGIDPATGNLVLQRGAERESLPLIQAVTA